MRRKTDIKDAVLRGVYEDNAGIPRSHQGNGRLKSSSESRQSAWYQNKAVLLVLFVLVAFIGADLRPVGVDASASIVHQPLSQVPSRPLPPTDTYGFFNQGTVPVFDRYKPTPVLHLASAEGNYANLLSYPGVLLADLFNLEVKTIVIDPGHGGIDSGATGHGGLKEKDVALDIAKRLRDKLIASGNHNVILTREDDRKIFLKERVAFATTERADLFISIHINSVPAEAGAVNYVETYYFGAHTNQQSLDLAEKENRDSDYSIGDFHDVIDRIGDTLKSQESELLAASIHQHLYNNLKRGNPDIMDAGFKTGPFMVLLGVTVPSVLVEVSCISNKAEEARLKLPEYRDTVASFLEVGIAEYLEQSTYRKTRQRGQVQYVVQREQENFVHRD